MNTTMYKFPSIEQFRHVVKTIERDSKYEYDEKTDDYVFNPALKSPTLRFYGSVKLHGTNAGIVFSPNQENPLQYFVWGQSRSNVITPEKDNAGFATWMSGKEVGYSLSAIHAELADAYPEIQGKTFVIYGEWCGGNIQKGVAITGLPNMFVIFGVKVIMEDEEANYWLDTTDYGYLNSHCVNIYHIEEFPTWEIDIDFNDPSRSVAALQELTEQVEQQCPVGKHFGSDGIGEGIVWTHRKEDGSVLRFKVKGEKHSSSKVKTLAPVDIEKLNSVREFVEYAVTESRLIQAASDVLDIISNPKSITKTMYEFDRKKLGSYIKWVSSDIVKEELDTLTENGLTMKDVGSSISKAAKDWFFKQEAL